MNASAQLPVRLSVLILVGLTYLAGVLGLDVILGAFAAGMVVGLVAKGKGSEPLRAKLDGIGFGFCLPIFFIVSGMRFDVAALLESPASLVRVPVFLLPMLAVRGLPALGCWRALDRRDLAPLALFSSTALPLIVAITEIGTQTGRMQPENAAALVGAGMISMLVFPLLGPALRGRGRSGLGIEEPATPP